MFILRRGIINYRSALAEGKPEIIIRDGKNHLKIYRGLEVPGSDTYSEGDDQERRESIIDLGKPGISWSPIFAYARSYSLSRYNIRRCILFALAPMDNQEILLATIEHNRSLDKDDWGDYSKRIIRQISDALIVEVPPHCYKFLKEIKIIESSGNFSINSAL